MLPAVAPPRRATLFIMVVTIIAFLLTLLGSKNANAVEGAVSPYAKGNVDMSGFSTVRDDALTGGIRESQAPMEALRASLKSQPPEVFDRWRNAR